MRIAALALLLTSCGPHLQPPAIDPRLAAQVPADASAVAGFRPSALRTTTTAFGDARYVLIAIRGPEILTATLAADGSVSAPRTRPPGLRSPLLEEGESLAARYPAWAVIRGSAPLPLQGNLANLNNLLRDASLITLAAQPSETLAIELTAACPSEDAARRFEGSLRAVLLLTKLAASAQIHRDGMKVKASLVASPDAFGRLLR